MGTKISALSTLAVPTEGDWFVVVDTSAGATKKVAVNPFVIEAGAGQTDPLLDLRDETDGTVFSVEPDGSMATTMLKPIREIGGTKDYIDIGEDELGAIRTQRSGSASLEVSFQAANGQTSLLFWLGDSNGNDIFAVKPDNKIGFFGATPVAQSAAGTTAGDAIACLKAFGLMAT